MSAGCSYIVSFYSVVLISQIGVIGTNWFDDVQPITMSVKAGSVIA